ncbi:unnamed protein product, partial [Ectocarpus sp. 12 AP-2014]
VSFSCCQIERRDPVVVNIWLASGVVSAPARTRAFTVERWPFVDASISGENPSFARASISVLVLPSRVDTTRLLPSPAARYRGVRPNLLLEFGKAPPIKRLPTRSPCPPSAATWKGTH